jgi:3-hydroxyacyl-CoA dehydrogenase
MSYATHGNVAVITMQNPPMNTMSRANRSAVDAAVKAANADAAIEAIVILGGGKVFSSGAEIREFNSPAATATPNLNEVIGTLEASKKPITAAVHGVAMGGGLELALGCHYRVALAGAQIALPEVKLGLLPGAGGTQRLPRLVGAEMGSEFVVSGNPVMSEKFAPGTLFDAMVEGDLTQAAVAYAKTTIGKPLKLARDITLTTPDAAFFAEAKAKVAKQYRGFPAPLKCVEAVEASVTMTFEAGLKFERECFMHLVTTTESKAMRHAFFGERTVAKIPDVPEDTPTKQIKQAAIIGAGTMGGGIAMNFANAGIPVKLLEMKQEALDKGLATILKNYTNTMKKGRLTQAQVDKRMACVTGTLNYADLADADIVIEAVFEDMAVKEKVFQTLDATMKPGAILASNTSTLDVNKIASFTKRPEDVIGTHFFSPANVMRLLEVVRGAKTSKPVLASTMKLAKAIKKVGVVSGVCDGFIGNRMIEQYSRQAGFLLEEGALPQQVDAAIEKWGMAMGPFRMGDMAGNDVGWYIRKRRYQEQPNMVYSRIADQICELGRYGQKTGAGFYKYDEKRNAIPDPEIDALIVKYSADNGITRRTISDQEIIDRLVFALVNEAAYIIEEGIAMRAVDVDMIYLTGYGFPMYRGGPMFYADTVGLQAVVARMGEFAKNRNGEFWKPAPLLAKLAAEGKTFN